MSLIKKAQSFANNAHEGQVRKYGGEPYIDHPIRVAMLLIEFIPNISEEMVAAALLHDVLEDTDTTLDDLIVEFGYAVAHLVFRVD